MPGQMPQTRRIRTPRQIGALRGRQGGQPVAVITVLLHLDQIPGVCRMTEAAPDRPGRSSIFVCHAAGKHALPSRGRRAAGQSAGSWLDHAAVRLLFRSPLDAGLLRSNGCQAAFQGFRLNAADLAALRGWPHAQV